jgi:putative ABC transport system permease protein
MESQYTLIDLSYIDLAIGFGLMLLTAGFSKLKGLGMGRDLIISSIRTFIQLIAVGFLLKYIFTANNPYLIVLVVIVMLAVSILTVTWRLEKRTKDLPYIVGISMFLGTGLSVFILTQLLLNINPWYEPYYLIPIVGMIIGNSMTGATLAVERIDSEIKSRSAEIEAYLALGASSREAGSACVKSALKAAMIPTINTMMVVGIVSLPGMMTGQILSGTSPLTAVKYQIIIMYMIALSVGVTSLILTNLRFKRYFTPHHQLKEDAL